MNELLRKAIDLDEDEKVEEAVELYRQVLKREPDSIAAQHRLGVALTRLRKMEEAETMFRQVLQRCPHHIEAHLSLGICLLQNGDAEGAYTQFKFVVQVAPNWPGGHANMGNALLKLQRAEEAVASYQRSLDITPSASVYVAQSNVFMMLGDFEKAMSMVRQALELDPHDADLIALLGRHHSVSGEIDQAAECFRRVSEIDALNIDAINQNGELLLELGRIEEAEAQFRKILDADPDQPLALLNLTLTLRARGQTDQAEEFLQRALEVNPSSAEWFDQAVRRLICVGRVEEATRFLDKWLELAPDNPIAHHLRAACTGSHTGTRASNDYVRAEFDRFATHFEWKLRALRYCGPELVEAAMAKHVPADGPQLDILDAGCGTGLCADILRSRARKLVGVDLSEGMIAGAAVRDVYDELVTAELTSWLAEQTSRFDLIVSADLLIYFGDVTLFVEVAAQALKQDGKLIFTVEELSGSSQDIGFQLNSSGRYSHTERHLRGALAKAGLVMVSVETHKLRTEHFKPVTGLVCVAVAI